MCGAISFLQNFITFASKFLSTDMVFPTNKFLPPGVYIGHSNGTDCPLLGLLQKKLLRKAKLQATAILCYCMKNSYTIFV